MLPEHQPTCFRRSVPQVLGHPFAHSLYVDSVPYGTVLYRFSAQQLGDEHRNNFLPESMDPPALTPQRERYESSNVTPSFFTEIPLECTKGGTEPSVPPLCIRISSLKYPAAGQEWEDRELAAAYFKLEFNSDLHVPPQGVVFYEKQSISKGLLLAFFVIAKLRVEQDPANKQGPTSW
jgi:hypothetical protein